MRNSEDSLSSCSKEIGEPCVICTSCHAILRISLTSMIPRTQKGGPALHHAIVQAQHFRDLWPRSTSHQENKFAASGGFTEMPRRTVSGWFRLSME